MEMYLVWLFSQTFNLLYWESLYKIFAVLIAGNYLDYPEWGLPPRQELWVQPLAKGVKLLHAWWLINYNKETGINIVTHSLKTFKMAYIKKKNLKKLISPTRCPLI